uniref:Uncharacterized protein n=1 Tax=Rhizophora mucronata TaxID=61149 RepID=A0A2P2PXU2_RHIMU
MGLNAKIMNHEFFTYMIGSLLSALKRDERLNWTKQ